MSAIRPVTAAYVPPPDKCNAGAFWSNLNKFPVAGDLLLFSEHDWPGVRKLRSSPEKLKGAMVEMPGRAPQPNKFAINNVLWLTALRIAHLEGYTHMLYLETDCRVGRKGWDQVVFEEFFTLGRPCVAAGTLVCYNPASWNTEAHRRWEQLVSRNDRRNYPIATYGWKGAAEQGGTCVFPNGALAVYDIGWMRRYFDLECTEQVAAKNTAFDMVLGQLIWNEFEEDAYEVLGYLNSVYSGYGDVVTTPQMRQNLLLSGKVVATHQHKDAWTP